MSAPSFARRLGLVAAAGLVVRVGVVLVHYRHLPLGFTDNFYYSVQARALADGAGYVDPFIWRDTGAEVASADHPPLYSTFLAPFSWLADGATVHRLASCLLGVATVVLVGLAARATARLVVGGEADRAGLAAALVAAVHPALWIADATIVAESLYAPAIAAILLVSLRFVELPTVRRAGVVGSVVGAAALVRAEAASLTVLLVVPLVLIVAWRGHGRDGWIAWGRMVLRTGGTAALVFVLVVAPWVVRNLRTFDEPVLFSVGAGFVLKVGNCDLTYEGDRLGYWAFECAYEGFDDTVDRSVHEQRAREQAVAYMGDHLGRLPVVVAARVGRTYHLYRPVQSIDFDAFFERRGRLPSIAGLAVFYLTVALAITAVTRRWHDRIGLLGPGAVVLATTITTATAFGITRYRIGADVALIVLAGVGVDRLLARHRRRAGPNVEVGGST